MDVVDQIEKIHEKVMKLEKDTIAELVKFGVPEKLAFRLVTNMAKGIMEAYFARKKL